MIRGYRGVMSREVLESKEKSRCVSELTNLLTLLNMYLLHQAQLIPGMLSIHTYTPSRSSDK
jgi:hypothetical protein